MKAILCWTFAAVVALSGLLLAQSAEKRDAGHASAKEGPAREKLIGAWNLVQHGCTRAGPKPHAYHSAEGNADLGAGRPHVGAAYVPQVGKCLPQ
jgi:hypothetical protein